ncbi:DNA (Cytosine-5)-methyltransferase DRM1/2 isoform 2 [Hibiscus syriacus]|uniref:DNA (Cytosine-5)-methyltransferase DRM1/2 isoform 2 n=1 Tax=Hibiscus syriacus TaxID=106335 RepID=A0A6A2XCU5_HIBSY|nr:DNA (Cytosine-5)-methyltransferase DRM1/2 isoform 2 [Hibiscus syriacus]
MQHVDSDNYSSDYEATFHDDFTDIDSSSDTEEILNSNSDEENKLLYLMKMGYSKVEASIAMERCVPDSSIAKLTVFICVVQMAKATDALLSKEKKLLNEDDHAIHLPNPMIGFGGPTKPDQITQRTLPEDVIGPLYFYYENVALAPVDVWTEISRDVEVAFYCLGIPLKTDAQELNGDRLEQLMSRFDIFDLVVSGIQCNNLTGRNKPHQDELKDFCWCIFF